MPICQPGHEAAGRETMYKCAGPPSGGKDHVPGE